MLKEIWQEVKRKKPVVCPHCTETFLNSLVTGVTSCPHCGKVQAVHDGALVPDVLSVRAYDCPTCGVSIQSPKTDGRINARRHCGHTFTVAGGEVVQKPNKTYTYKCPTCGVSVKSSKKDGRVAAAGIHLQSQEVRWSKKRSRDTHTSALHVGCRSSPRRQMGAFVRSAIAGIHLQLQEVR